MSFATLAGLLVALLVAAPIAAHLLRRRQAEERPFPPARLVPATPPVARRRSMLEDRALFGIRALAVVALAVLGATPFLRCSRLALTRQGGASVAMAIVIDDSLSMRAPLDGGAARSGATTRWDRALAAARELQQGARPGDSIAVVLAGAPARVALASTTNLAAGAEALEGLEPSDRSTDLEGAIRLGRELLKSAHQLDKRVVVLSDLADGAPEAPLATEGAAALWIPLAELESTGADCGITRADRAAGKVTARVACSPPPSAPPAPDASAAGAPTAAPAAPSASEGRSLEIRAGDRVLASSKLGAALRAEDVTIDLPADAPADLTAALTGADSIAEDDQAPVIAAGGSLPVAVVVDAAATHVETGGPPPIEQAFAALSLDASVRPLPTVPEHAEELDAFAALVIDDVPGLTPEVRRSVAAWIERGGVALVTLGQRAASAPLGSGFEPLVPGVVRWAASPVPGADPASASSFGPSAEGLADLAPKGRAVLDVVATEGADVLARWADGAPLLMRRSLGRGAVLTLTLPLTTEESDLALRPAFLALVDRLVSTARARGGARRIDVGESWTFDGFDRVVVERVALTRSEKRRPVPVGVVDERLRATPPLAGLYELVLDGERSTRVAAVAEREIDLRPRRVEPAARAATLGGVAATLDASPYVALALLALLAAELLLRSVGQRAEPETRAAHVAQRPRGADDG